MMTSRAGALALPLAFALGLAMAGGARAQMFFAPFPQQTGEAIYQGICQGCHMPNAMGATGAGTYPALAGDKKLVSGAYPALTVLRGRKAMPAFGPQMSDAQVAAVVNYVRTNFGNHYADPVTPEMVKALRPPPAASSGE
jgi:mono/diheme cytochrome c family protein